MRKLLALIALGSTIGMIGCWQYDYGKDILIGAATETSVSQFDEKNLAN